MNPVDLVALIATVRDDWQARPGVIGVGGTLYGDDGWITVWTDRPVRGLPKRVGGVRVEVIRRTRTPLGKLAS